MRKLFSLLLCLALCLGAAASAEEAKSEAFTSGAFRYILRNDGTAKIISYSSEEKTLTIPTELDGHPVTALGDFAIGDEGFGDLIVLDNEELTSVTIPDSVTELGVNPFGGCINLETINVSPDHPTLAVIDGVLFSKPDKRLVCYPYAFAKDSCAIPRGTRIIGDEAFAGCYYLTAVTIPDGVTVIGNSAFSRCSNLISVTIPNSVTSIGNDVFFSCDSLTSVTIPDGVTVIGDNPFRSCSRLADIAVSDNHPCLEMIDGVLFSKPDRRLVCYPSAMKADSYTIPRGTEIIGNYAFFYELDLTSVTIPDGVTIIGDEAFTCCDSLTAVAIPDGVTRIGDYAFDSSSALTAVTIPDSVTCVGNNPFAFCDSLTDIIVSDDHPYLETIDGVLFSKPDRRLICYPCSFKSPVYTVPRGTEMIGDNAFESCYSLVFVSTPESLTRIGNEAFMECENLTFVTLLGKVTCIGDYAFWYCRELISVTIPDSLVSIGEYAFHNCQMMNDITLPDSVTGIGDEAFTVFNDCDHIPNPDLVITVSRDSYAERYCGCNGIEYTYPDDPGRSVPEQQPYLYKVFYSIILSLLR